MERVKRGGRKRGDSEGEKKRVIEREKWWGGGEQLSEL